MHEPGSGSAGTQIEEAAKSGAGRASLGREVRSLKGHGFSSETPLFVGQLLSCFVQYLVQFFFLQEAREERKTEREREREKRRERENPGRKRTS